MIDIHSHLLYGVDDGSKNVTACMEMARQALACGMTHLILTPHHLHGQYLNPKQQILQQINDLQIEFHQQELPLTLLPGQEVTLTSEFLDEMQADRLLTLNHSRYMLVELPHDHIPKPTEDVFYELSIRGIIPIITHPERNQAIMANPERLGRLISYGALSQLTASSLTDVSQAKLQKLAMHLCKQRWVHCIASDAHDSVRRPYGLLEAYQLIESTFGSEMKQYFIENTQRIVNNETIPEVPSHNRLSQSKIFRLFAAIRFS
jgi:protein-tyrosine phosphatase